MATTLHGSWRTGSTPRGGDTPNYVYNMSRKDLPWFADRLGYTGEDNPAEMMRYLSGFGTAEGGLLPKGSYNSEIVGDLSQLIARRGQNEFDWDPNAQVTVGSRNMFRDLDPQGGRYMDSYFREQEQVRNQDNWFDDLMDNAPYIWLAGAGGMAAGGGAALGSGSLAEGAMNLGAGSSGLAEGGALASEMGFVPGSFELGAGSGLTASNPLVQGAGGMEWLDLLKKYGMGTTKAGSLFNVGSGVYGMYKSQQMQKLAEQAMKNDNPFGPERAQYATMLRELYANPKSITKMPGYKAGLEAVTRKMASQGYLGSGNMMAALQKYGGDAFNAEAARLAQLAGAQFAPNSGATLQGQYYANDLASKSLASIGYGLRGWNEIFGSV